MNTHCKQASVSGRIDTEEASVGLPGNTVIATVVWNSPGIIHINYLQRGRTVIGECYVISLD